MTTAKKHYLDHSVLACAHSVGHMLDISRMLCKNSTAMSSWQHDLKSLGVLQLPAIVCLHQAGGLLAQKSGLKYTLHPRPI